MRILQPARHGGGNNLQGMTDLKCKVFVGHPADCIADCKHNRIDVFNRGRAAQYAGVRIQGDPVRQHSGTNRPCIIAIATAGRKDLVESLAGNSGVQSRGCDNDRVIDIEDKAFGKDTARDIRYLGIKGKITNG